MVRILNLAYALYYPTNCLPASFKLFAPRLFDYYKTSMDALFAHELHLQRPFKDSPWAAATFNLGPSTITFRHTDPGNLLWGWCEITSLGPFDFKLGGHIVLWELKLVIKFPPGSTIFIPSALITHSNVPIQDGERRYSFTQYCAGGLFRYVANGFRSDKVFMAQASKEEKRAREEARVGRWERGLAMLPTLSELNLAASDNS
jgi:hypothetical protein